MTVRDLRYGGEGEFVIVSCPQCGTGRTSPALPDVSDWYPVSYQNFLGRDSIFDRIFIRATRANITGDAPRRRAVSWLVPAADLGGPVAPGMRVLDVGAGSGHMIGALRRGGVDAWGVEPSADAVAHARARGVNTVQHGVLESFVKAHQEDRWDIVRFWHTLEHMPDPLEDLSLARSILAPTGRVVIGVPNFGGAMGRLTGAAWDGLEIPRHYTHFTASGLAEIMGRAGFAVQRMRTVAVMGVTPASVLHRLGRGSFPSIPLMVLTHPLEMMLAAFGRGDGLLAIGRPQNGST
jgi:SAM-dependent methyltransferase